MKVGFQMDHPTRLNAATDSTFMLIEEAQRRGYQPYCFQPHDLSWKDGTLLANATPIRVDMGTSPGFTLGEDSMLPLAETGVVWMRQDPPFNMHYITATHLLEHAGTRVVNDPTGVRNAPEKLAVLHRQGFMPPTLISHQPGMIRDFASEHGTVIAKPLHGYGGRSVFRFTADDPNLETLIEQWREQTAEALMWQAFLPEVATADVRIILIDGEVAAIFQREPQGESIRANMRVGGIAKKTGLTARQQEVTAALAPMLKEQGLLFVGLDMIGDYLTEINVTSPTGLRAAQSLYGTNLAAALWDKIA